MLESENGIVGFFDIMGYQNIIDNNKIEYVARIISETIERLPEEAKESFLYIFRSSARSAVKTPGKDVEAVIENAILFVEQIMNRIKSLLISDSIIISLAFDNSGGESDPIADKKLEWMYFLTFTAFLLKKAFDAGLPLRGAIDTGPYLIHGYIFAGKPIIESYRLSAQLQFSGCALTNSARAEIDKLYEDNDASNDVFFKPIFTYLAPLSDRDERLNLIDWYVGEHDLQKTDIRQSVIEAFHAHNKDIPRKVLPVIENTEMILRHIISRKWFLRNSEEGSIQ